MEDVRSIYWEAPEHHHIEKSGDWFWILGIIGISGSVVSIILDNVLFGVVILLATITMMMSAHKRPRVIPFEIGPRGVRIEDDLYPYATLASFSIDEETPTGPQLILRSQKLFAPLLILPIPETYIDDIEDILGPKLREEHLEEPIAHKIMELFGF